MNNILDTVGNIAAIIGILVCLVAGVGRITGSYYIMGFEAVTLFIGGIALMVFATLAKIQKLSAG